MAAKKKPAAKWPKSEYSRIRLTRNYKDIKSSLFEQLERSGNDTKFFQNLLEDYMALYTVKELCKKDIDARGVTVTSQGSQGQTVTKKNDSVELLIKSNQQMIKILDMLKIRVESDTDVDFEL